MVRQLQTLPQLLFIKKPQLCLKFVISIAEDLALSKKTWLLISLLKLANAEATIPTIVLSICSQRDHFQ